ncbi:MAG: hypothetical protein IPM74_09730 [Crocinitomicaceae bacterium]|nr:hypothetical protein [Crocinitomicaceae bacterium]MBK8926171.1 hypothetical protein [Crocinitomicaceae bacterium]
MILRSVLFAFFLWMFVLPSDANEVIISVKIFSEDYSSQLQNAHIEINAEGANPKKYSADSSGQISQIKLEFNQQYVVRFMCRGYVSKLAWIDTRVAPDYFSGLPENNTLSQKMEVSLFKKAPRQKLKFLKTEPMIKFTVDENYLSLTWDIEYTKTMLQRVEEGRE